MNGMRPQFPWTSYRDGESLGPGDRREEPAESEVKTLPTQVLKEALV